MKNYSWFQRIVSISLIVVMLVQNSGCITTSNVSSSAIPVSEDFYYKVHEETATFLLEKTIITEGILSGKIIPEESAHSGKMIHIYLKEDSVMKMITEKTVSIPVNCISEVKMAKVSKGRTILLFTGCVIAFFLGAAALSLRNTNYFPNGL